MPDILFFQGEPRNRLYDYYLHGAADVVVEFIQPGCEEYIDTIKKPIYQEAGVPARTLTRQQHPSCWRSWKEVTTFAINQLDLTIWHRLIRVAIDNTLLHPS